MPTFERLLDRARALTAATTSWETGKTVGDIRTFSLKPLSGKGPRWWARVSEHGPRNGKSAFELVSPQFRPSEGHIESTWTPRTYCRRYVCLTHSYTLCLLETVSTTKRSGFILTYVCPTCGLLTFYPNLARWNKDLESAQYLKNCLWGESMLPSPSLFFLSCSRCFLPNEITSYSLVVALHIPCTTLPPDFHHPHSHASGDQQPKGTLGH